MKNLWFVLIAFVLISCTKTENGLYVQKSMPYSANIFQTKGNTKVNDINGMTVYDSSRNIETEIQVSNYNTNEEREAKAMIMFTEDGASIVKQITFLNYMYPNLKKVTALPLILDIDSDDTLELPILMEFKDSFLVGLYEFCTERNKRWIMFKDFGKEDNHFLQYLTYQVDKYSNSKILYFRKTNRLMSNENRNDTIIAYDIANDKVIFKTPFGACINFSINLINSKNPVFVTSNTSNGTSFEGFDDFHSYFVSFDMSGEIKWYYDYSNIQNIPGSSYKISSRFEYNHLPLLFFDGNKTNFKILDLINGNVKNIKEFKFKVKDYMIINSGSNSMIYVNHDNNKISIIDNEGNLILQRDYKVEINSLLPSVHNIPNSTGYRLIDNSLGNKTYDINNDGILDFLITTNKNQFTAIDGRTLEPLFALDPIKDFGSGFFVKERDSYRLTILSNGVFSQYHIQPNSLFVRLSAYKLELLSLMTLLIISPMLIFFSMKIKYYTSIFRALTSKNNDEGIIIYDAKGNLKSYINKSLSSFIGKNFKIQKNIKSYNHELVQVFEESIKTNKEIKKQITILIDKEYHYLINFKPMNPYFKTKFVILIVSDITKYISEQKNKNIISTSLMIAHTIRNYLGTSLLELDSLKSLIENAGLNDQAVQEIIENIKYNIKDSGDVIRRISYTAKEIIESNLEPTNINEFIESWIIEYENRFKRRGIDLINDIEIKDLVLYLNKRSFDLLLQTACDNSSEANHNKEIKYISFSIEKLTDKITFIIKDNGIGMDKETIKKLMANSGYSTKRAGSGLGIQLIHKVCKEHYATLDIDSELNKGTSLKIIFNGENNNE